MAHIRQVPESEATGRLKQIYDAAQARAGTVDNIIKEMGEGRTLGVIVFRLRGPVTE